MSFNSAMKESMIYNMPSVKCSTQSSFVIRNEETDLQEEYRILQREIVNLTVEGEMKQNIIDELGKWRHILALVKDKSSTNAINQMNDVLELNIT